MDHSFINSKDDDNKLLVPSVHPDEVTGTGYSRTEKIKEYLQHMPDFYYFLIYADSLLTWLNKGYPLESDPVQEEVFMSDELSIAVECNRALYSTAPVKGATAKVEGPKIRAWIDKHYPDHFSDTTATRITRVINPGVK